MHTEGIAEHEWGEVRWREETTRVHAAHIAEQRICAADLRAVRARNPLVHAMAMPADPCRALALLAAKK